MTVAALLEAAGSGRSAPSASRLKPYRNEGGRPAKPAVDLPSDVCNFRLSEVRNFRLTLTDNVVGHGGDGSRRPSACHPEVLGWIGNECDGAGPGLYSASGV